jgi:phage gp45-like
MLLEHEDAVRVTTRRARLDKINDDGTQQLVDFRGLKNEVLQKVWRPMEFGFFSMPPKDSDGVMIQMGSRADRTLYYDGGHKDYRPKKRPAGSAGLFDQYGNLLQSEKNQVGLTHNTKIVLQLGKGYDAKDASDYSGNAASIAFDKDNAMTLTYAGSTVTIDKNGNVVAKAKSEFAGGVDGGRWVVARSGRVDLGVTSPSGQAVNKVATDAGYSEIVYAEIA